MSIAPILLRASLYSIHHHDNQTDRLSGNKSNELPSIPALAIEFPEFCVSVVSSSLLSVMAPRVIMGLHRSENNSNNNKGKNKNTNETKMSYNKKKGSIGYDDSDRHQRPCRCGVVSKMLSFWPDTARYATRLSWFAFHDPEDFRERSNLWKLLDSKSASPFFHHLEAAEIHDPFCFSIPMPTALVFTNDNDDEDNNNDGRPSVEVDTTFAPPMASLAKLFGNSQNSPVKEIKITFRGLSTDQTFEELGDFLEKMKQRQQRCSTPVNNFVVMPKNTQTSRQHTLTRYAARVIEYLVADPYHLINITNNKNTNDYNASSRLRLRHPQLESYSVEGTSCPGLRFDGLALFPGSEQRGSLSLERLRDHRDAIRAVAIDILANFKDQKKLTDLRVVDICKSLHPDAGAAQTFWGAAGQATTSSLVPCFRFPSSQQEASLTMPLYLRALDLSHNPIFCEGFYDFPQEDHETESKNKNNGDEDDDGDSRNSVSRFQKRYTNRLEAKRNFSFINWSCLYHLPLEVLRLKNCGLAGHVDWDGLPMKTLQELDLSDNANLYGPLWGRKIVCDDEKYYFDDDNTELSDAGVVAPQLLQVCRLNQTSLGCQSAPFLGNLLRGNNLLSKKRNQFYAFDVVANLPERLKIFDASSTNLRIIFGFSTNETKEIDILNSGTLQCGELECFDISVEEGRNDRNFAAQSSQSNDNNNINNNGISLSRSFHPNSLATMRVLKFSNVPNLLANDFFGVALDESENNEDQILCLPNIEILNLQNCNVRNGYFPPNLSRLLFPCDYSTSSSAERRKHLRVFDISGNDFRVFSKTENDSACQLDDFIDAIVSTPEYFEVESICTFVAPTAKVLDLGFRQAVKTRSKSSFDINLLSNPHLHFAVSFSNAEHLYQMIANECRGESSFRFLNLQSPPRDTKSFNGNRSDSLGTSAENSNSNALSDRDADSSSTSSSSTVFFTVENNAKQQRVVIPVNLRSTPGIKNKKIENDNRQRKDRYVVLRPEPGYTVAPLELVLFETLRQSKRFIHSFSEGNNNNNIHSLQLVDVRVSDDLEEYATYRDSEFPVLNSCVPGLFRMNASKQIGQILENAGVDVRRAFNSPDYTTRVERLTRLELLFENEKTDDDSNDERAFKKGGGTLADFLYVLRLHSYAKRKFPREMQQLRQEIQSQNDITENYLRNASSSSPHSSSTSSSPLSRNLAFSSALSSSSSLSPSPTRTHFMKPVAPTPSKASPCLQVGSQGQSSPSSPSTPQVIPLRIVRFILRNLVDSMSVVVARAMSINMGRRVSAPRRDLSDSTLLSFNTRSTDSAGTDQDGTSDDAEDYQTQMRRLSSTISSLVPAFIFRPSFYFFDRNAKVFQTIPASLFVGPTFSKSAFRGSVHNLDPTERSFVSDLEDLLSKGDAMLNLKKSDCDAADTSASFRRPSPSSSPDHQFELQKLNQQIRAVASRRLMDVNLYPVGNTQRGVNRLSLCCLTLGIVSIELLSEGSCHPFVSTREGTELDDILQNNCSLNERFRNKTEKYDTSGLLSSLSNIVENVFAAENHNKSKNEEFNDGTIADSSLQQAGLRVISVIKDITWSGESDFDLEKVLQDATNRFCDENIDQSLDFARRCFLLAKQQQNPFVIQELKNHSWIKDDNDDDEDDDEMKVKLLGEEYDKILETLKRETLK